MTTLTYGGAALIGYSLLALSQRDTDFSSMDAVRISEAAEGFFAGFKAHAAEHRVDLSSIEALYGDAAPAIDDTLGRYLNATEPRDYALSDESNGWLWIAAVWFEATTTRIRDAEVALG